MSSVLGERDAYLKSPYYKKQKFGDFTEFYIVITICSVIGISLFLLNIVLGCCSRYSEYWNDRHTGNRWIVSLWTATPHKQPALDYTELQDICILPQQHVVYHHPPPPLTPAPTPPVELKYLELRKRESDI